MSETPTPRTDAEAISGIDVELDTTSSKFVRAAAGRLKRVVRFSDTFKGLPLRKVEFLCGQGGSVVSVTVKDKYGNLATVDEWAKVLWHMSDVSIHAPARGATHNKEGQHRE